MYFELPLHTDPLIYIISQFCKGKSNNKFDTDYIHSILLDLKHFIMTFVIVKVWHIL